MTAATAASAASIFSAAPVASAQAVFQHSAKPFRPLGKASSPVNITLAIRVTDQPSVNPIVRLVKEYNRTHPGIRVTLQTGVDAQKVGVELAAGTAPDVVMFYSADDVGQYAYQGGLLPLNSFIRGVHFDTSGLVRAAVKQGISPYDGKLYALSFLEDSYEVYYNKAMFQKAGIRTLPKTLQQMVVDAKKLTKRDAKGDITQLGWDCGVWGEDEPNLAGLFGANLTNASGTKSAIDSPQFIKGLQFQLDAYNALGGYKAVNRFVTSYAEGGINAGQNSSLGPFSSGHEGMTIRGDYYTDKLSRVAPKLNYGTFLLPGPAGGPNTVGGSPMGGNPVSITKDSRHPQDAWNFVQWLMTQGQIYIAQNQLMTGNFAATPDLVSLLRHHQSWEHNPHFRWFWNVMLTDKHLFNLPLVANQRQYVDLINQEVQNMLNGQVTPAQTAKAISSEENRDLAALGVS